MITVNRGAGPSEERGIRCETLEDAEKMALASVRTTPSQYELGVPTSDWDWAEVVLDGRVLRRYDWVLDGRGRGYSTALTEVPL